MPRTLLSVLVCFLMLLSGCSSTTPGGRPHAAANCSDSPLATLYIDGEVAGSGTGETMDTAFRTISEAVAAAAPRDRLCIAPGTYSEGATLLIDKDLVLEGVTGEAGSVILDGAKAYRVVTVEAAATVTMKNLSITGGSATGAKGGGIDNAGHLSLTDVLIQQNSADYGGGINNTGTLVLGSGTTVARNVAHVSGGGIAQMTAAGSLMMLAGSSVADNVAFNGCGGICNLATMTMSEGSSITGNVAMMTGGGIASGGPLLLKSGALVSGNSAGDTGGGIDILAGNVNLETGSIITGNFATSGGGIRGAAVGDTGGVTGNYPDDIKTP